MHLFRRFTQGQLRLTRIEAFSVAGALLVLDLKVPVLHDLPAAFVVYALTPIFYLTPQGPGGAKETGSVEEP